MNGLYEQVRAHYGDGGLRSRIESALLDLGLDPTCLTTRDLAPVDEFHSRGRQATKELAGLAAPRDGERVLDVGSGIGGPARFLAQRFGCHVTGIDLTSEFCDVGNWLSQSTGLDDRVCLLQGSATSLPMDDNQFDLAWCIQMQMNIEQKSQLYREIHRVVKPGGRFVLQELCAGDGGPCHFPTPWASHGGLSFLIAPSALCEVVMSAGFRMTSWRDTTAQALDWYAKQNANARARAPSALGIHLVMGEMHMEKRANVERNYAQHRLRQVMGAFVKA